MLNIFKILLFSNIEIITENSTTNPPIITTVFILFIMLFPKISPKFEKETVLVSEVDVLGFLEVLDILPSI